MKMIHVLRKPFSKSTVAANTLEHGTGGLNIDTSRLDGARWPANTVLRHLDECAEFCVESCPVSKLDSQQEGARAFFLRIGEKRVE